MTIIGSFFVVRILMGLKKGTAAFLLFDKDGQLGRVRHILGIFFRLMRRLYFIIFFSSCKRGCLGRGSWRLSLFIIKAAFWHFVHNKDCLMLFMHSYLRLRWFIWRLLLFMNRSYELGVVRGCSRYPAIWLTQGMLEHLLVALVFLMIKYGNLFAVQLDLLASRATTLWW